MARTSPTGRVAAAASLADAAGRDAGTRCVVIFSAGSLIATGISSWLDAANPRWRVQIRVHDVRDPNALSAIRADLLIVVTGSDPVVLTGDLPAEARVLMIVPDCDPQLEAELLAGERSRCSVIAVIATP